MAEVTGISWCDSTANFWLGCSKVSPACDNCYAEGLATTRLRMAWGPGADRRYCKQGWSDCRKWQRAAARNGGIDPKLGRRRRVFVNSLSDFFDNHRSVVWRAEAWHLIRDCPDLIFILVTKRPQLIARELPEFWEHIARQVVLMTTAENQEWADRRVPELLASCEGRAQPACFGVSAEPMLGAIDLGLFLWGRAVPCDDCPCDADCRCGYQPRAQLVGESALGWVIVGGESGGQGRPMDPRWARSIRDQCAAAGVAFHHKQNGEWVAGPFDRDMVAPVNGPRSLVRGRSTREVELDGGWLAMRFGRARAGHFLDGESHLDCPEALAR